jgi:hypothetical protein
MSLDKRFRRIVFMQVMLGAVAFGIAAQNPALLLIVGAVMALSWYVTEGPRAWFLPQWAINVCALMVTGWVAFETLTKSVGLLPAIGHFVLGLQVVLLYARKSNMEHAQLMVLSLLLMIAAGAMGSSMVFGGLLLAYSALALISVLMLHLKTTSDLVQQANCEAAPGTRVVPSPKAVAGPGRRRDFRWLAIAVAVGCAAVAVTVFVVAPRPGSNSMSGKELGIRSGGGPLAPSVSLQSGLSGTGYRTVATVQPHPDDGQAPNPSRTWLMRGYVLYHYDAERQRWRRASNLGQGELALPAPDRGVSLANLPAGMPRQRVSVTLNQAAFENAPLFTVEAQDGPSVGPMHLQTRRPMKVLFHLAQRRLLTPKGRPAMASYQLTAPAVDVPELDQRYREHFAKQLEGSLPNPVQRGNTWRVEPERVSALARRVLERAMPDERSVSTLASQEPARIGHALARYLRRRYSYTLEHQPPPAGRDPVIHFLFNERSGHCELFASGMIAMARSIGVPARLVTGYRVSEYNTWGQYFVARSRNAHAWCELYAGPERGWVRFDPTPPAGRAQEHAVEGGWISWLRQGYEHAERGWMKTVIAFSNRDRQRLVDQAKNTAKSLAGNASSEETDYYQQTIAFLRSLPQRWRLNRVHYTLIAAIMLGLVIACGILIRLYLRRRQKLADLQLAALPRQRRRDLARKLGFYLTMLELLERYGYERPQWQSPFSFAQELAGREPQRFDPVLELTELFYELRFGYRELNDDRQQRVRSQLRQLEQNLARANEGKRRSPSPARGS